MSGRSEFEDGETGLEGVVLRSLLGQLNVRQSLSVGAAIAEALAALHATGSLHRELDPTQIWVSVGSGAAWLVGVPVSPSAANVRGSDPARASGGLAYLAPEGIGRTSAEMDSRADLYSLGVILYELATGNLPFAAHEPGEWVHAHRALRPIPPGEQRPMPVMVERILLKLLEKEPDDRYQTASGLTHDLRECLAQLTTNGSDAMFELGQRDAAGELARRTALLGRARELAALSAAVERVQQSRKPELVLVPGYSGIGKSSLIREFIGQRLPPHTLVVSGKFDDRESNAPYEALMQAFRELLSWTLARPSPELDQWQSTLDEALGSNSSVVAELLPNLKRIIEIDEHEEHLSADETKRRVYASFRRLLQAYAARSSPLVLFLDDLQWVDRASLDLVEHLLLDPDLGCLLVIFAYREESVMLPHPLTEAFERFRSAGLALRSVPVNALVSAEVAHLVADLLTSAPEDTLTLARLTEHKTGGNPFFVRQFVTAMKEERLLRFDPDRNSWSWDAQRIAAKSFTDNLSNLLLERLARLPAGTQSALETLACLGPRAPAPIFAELEGTTVDELAHRLVAAIQAEVIVTTTEGYAFQHDRLQTAAYSRIAEAERPSRHLAIGRALRARSDQLHGDGLFELVRHLNRASGLLTDLEERVQLASLNLELARRSRTTAASANASVNLELAIGLLPADHWQTLPDLSFDLGLARAESQYLRGEHERAEASLCELATHAMNTERRGAVVCLQVDLRGAAHRWAEAIDVGLNFLRSEGVPWQAFDQDELRQQHEQLRRALGGRELAWLSAAPALTSRAVRAQLEVCSRLAGPSAQMERAIFPMLALYMATLSIEHGGCELSAQCYAHLSCLLGPLFGDHALGLEFGRLAARVANLGEHRSLAVTCATIGVNVAPRVFGPHAGYGWLVRAREAADRVGDPAWGSVSRVHVVMTVMTRGSSLEEAEREAELTLQYTERHRFPSYNARARIMRALIHGLRVPGGEPGSLSDEQLDETSYEQELRGVMDRFYYWLRRLQARYFAGDFAGAREASRRARELPRASTIAHDLEFCFYAALAETAAADPGDVTEALQRSANDERELLGWAERCPPTFANKAALVAAERARLAGRATDAELGYERAANFARQYQLVHEEALAHELAGRFYADRGIVSVARAKLLLARACYVRWGALGKVAGLDGELESEAATPALTDTLDLLDVKVVVSALQAVSSTLELDQLTQSLMTSSLRHAAAERGLLVLLAGEPRIRARASVEATTIHVAADDAPLTSRCLPESILRYVLRSGEPVVTQNGVVPAAFRNDSYFERETVRSLLCLPIVVRGRVIGALYLENTLARQSYGARALAVLQLLASQAAISLENAQLYLGIQEAQQRMTRAERVSRTGSFNWRPQTQELGFSEELSNIFGIEGSPNIGLVRERTHPEDRALFEALATDTARYEGHTVEFRLIMPNGTVKHVAAIASRLGTEEYAGTVRDVTDSKQAEETLQRTQAALTDMTRLGSLAEMAAAIAHEVNQPIAGISLNASTCQRCLSDDRLDLVRARTAVQRIQRDGDRAANVVQRVRALFSKSDPVRAPVDLNHAISEVVAISRGQIRAAETALALELGAELPAALGDRVQLQQVVLNLLNNGLQAMSSEPQPRRLTIRTYVDEAGRLRCEVEDTGAGIDEAHRRRIFEPFYTTKRNGMGIGLSICKNLVASHDGELAVRTNGQGPGTTFYFSLPCVA